MDVSGRRLRKQPRPQNSMKVLIVNAGSSSLKFQLFNADGKKKLLKGLYDGIGEGASPAGCTRIISSGNDDISERCAVTGHESAIDDMLAMMVRLQAIQGEREIRAVGHRVVHGGETYSKTTRISDEVLSVLRRYSHLAPLHNPINIACIEMLMKRLPESKQYAVFDTAFHQTMPEKAFLYGLPYDLYTNHGIRKYGFHGTNHRYVASRAAELLGKHPSTLRVITCHLGNGQSICAVCGGVSVDTSMGFTPLEGLPMGTRSGSFDPEIVLHLLELGYSRQEIRDLINKKSGLLGISGISGDYRVIEEMTEAGNLPAIRAHELLVHRITGTIGSYIAQMGGVDSIAFTGGIGEHSARLRRDVLMNFLFLGLEIDEEKNGRNDAIITKEHSAISALVIAANEELQMMTEVMEAMRGRE